MRHFEIHSSTPPVVEIDSAACAAYVRFSHEKVAKTISEDAPGPVIAIDLDENDRVVGVELIGVKEFGIRCLMKLIPKLKAPRINWDRARYVPAACPDDLATA